MTTVRPLKSKTMTIDELRTSVLTFMRQTRKQFNRAAHDEGMSDNEFLSHVLDPLEYRIRADRDVEAMARKRAR